MLLDWRKLRGLPVYTVSGGKLGKVSSIIFDADLNTIFQYEVRVHRIGGRTFLINPSQIVEWKNDRIIVEDSLLSEFTPINLIESANT